MLPVVGAAAEITKLARGVPSQARYCGAVLNVPTPRVGSNPLEREGDRIARRGWMRQRLTPLEKVMVLAPETRFTCSKKGTGVTISSFVAAGKGLMPPGQMLLIWIIEDIAISYILMPATTRQLTI